MGHVLAVEQDAPAGRLDQPVDHLQRRRLAAARTARRARRARPRGTSRSSSCTATVPSSYRLPTPSSGSSVPVVASTRALPRSRRVSTEAANPWFSWDYVPPTPRTDAAGREHVLLTVASVVLALLVAFPLAVLVRRYRLLMAPVLAVSGVLYTIPSLALFSFLWPLFGPHRCTVLFGWRVRAAGPGAQHRRRAGRGRPGDVRRGRPGHGVRARRLLLWRVEVPLALPTIMAGVRIATVSTVALVTVGAVVGYGGLRRADPARLPEQLLARADLHRHRGMRAPGHGLRGGAALGRASPCPVGAARGPNDGRLALVHRPGQLDRARTASPRAPGSRSG